MAAEGTRVDPERGDRHDRRPAGDRPRVQDADRPRRRDRRRGADLPRRGADVQRLPGARSSRSRWTPTGCRSTRWRRRSTACRPKGRRPKFIYTIPNFQNPGGVTMSLRAAPAPGRGRARARAAGARGQPVRAAALRGRAAADAVLAGRARRSARGGALGPRDLPGHVLEDPLARACASAGRWRRGRCWRSSTSASRAPTCAPRRSRSCSSPPTSRSAAAHGEPRLAGRTWSG